MGESSHIGPIKNHFGAIFMIFRPATKGLVYLLFNFHFLNFCFSCDAEFPVPEQNNSIKLDEMFH